MFNLQISRVLLFHFIILIFTCSPLFGRRAIPDEYLTSALYIDLYSAGMGSGFFFRTESFYYLITAKHVLFDKDSLRSSKIKIIGYHPILLYGKRYEWEIDLKALNDKGLIKSHDHYDVTTICIGRIDSTSGETPLISYFDGVKRLFEGSARVAQFAPKDVKKFEDVSISNEIYLIGFPTSVGNFRAPQFEYTQPLLKRGIVSGLNYNTKMIILDCTAYFGNSGSPIIEIEYDFSRVTIRLIGVLTELIPFNETWINYPFGYANQNTSNSGYSLTVPMDIVLEMIGGH